MNSIRALRIAALVSTLILAGCVTPPPSANYTSLRAESPRSVLVVPSINKSVEVDAPDYFLSTITMPLAERGYYVFPVNLVKALLADDGLNDANLVHSGDPLRLGEIFGADSVMYISIEQWNAKYMLFTTTVTVELNYSLKSAHTGQELWKNHQVLVYQPQGSTAPGLAGLIADAINAAITKAAPNYMPLARQANAAAVVTKHTGLPAGPYDSLYQKDASDF